MARLIVGQGNHRSLCFLNYEQMSAALNAIIRAQGYKNRYLQYECTELLPQSLLGVRGLVKLKQTGDEFEMRLFLKNESEHEATWNASISALSALRKKSSFVTLYDLLEDDSSKSIVLSKLGKKTLYEVVHNHSEVLTYSFFQSTIAELAKILF